MSKTHFLKYVCIMHVYLSKAKGKSDLVFKSGSRVAIALLQRRG